MVKKYIFGLLVVGLCGAVAFSSPIGAPVSSLDEGQFSIGFDYSNSDLDLVIEDEDISTESNQMFGNIGYGVVEDVDVFVRLGMAQIEDSDYEFAWGFGAKATLYEEEDLAIGALFQMNWISAEDEVDGYCIEADAYEMKIAVGPSYQIADGVCVFGGPMLHYLRGDADVDDTYSADIEEDSQFGGYVGIGVEIAENMPCSVEYQMTGGANIFGFNLTYEF